jgi:hypothetical protein
MAAIVLGCGMTSMGRLGQTATMLMQRALERALGDARVALHDVKGLIAVPSLAEPRFMHAHFLATRVGLLPATEVLVRTIGDFSFLRPFFFFLVCSRHWRCRTCFWIVGSCSHDRKQRCSRCCCGCWRRCLLAFHRRVFEASRRELQKSGRSSFFSCDSKWIQPNCRVAVQDVRHDKRTTCNVCRLDVCPSVSASIVAQLQEEASDLGASVGKVVFKKLAKLFAFLFWFSVLKLLP